MKNNLIRTRQNRDTELILETIRRRHEKLQHSTEDDPSRHHHVVASPLSPPLDIMPTWHHDGPSSAAWPCGQQQRNNSTHGDNNNNHTAGEQHQHQQSPTPQQQQQQLYQYNSSHHQHASLPWWFGNEETVHIKHVLHQYHQQLNIEREKRPHNSQRPTRFIGRIERQKPKYVYLQSPSPSAAATDDSNNDDSTPHQQQQHERVFETSDEVCIYERGNMPEWRPIMPMKNRVHARTRWNIHDGTIISTEIVDKKDQNSSSMDRFSSCSIEHGDDAELGDSSSTDDIDNDSMDGPQQHQRPDDVSNCSSDDATSGGGSASNGSSSSLTSLESQDRENDFLTDCDCKFFLYCMPVTNSNMAHRIRRRTPAPFTASSYAASMCCHSPSFDDESDEFAYFASSELLKVGHASELLQYQCLQRYFCDHVETRSLSDGQEEEDDDSDEWIDDDQVQHHHPQGCNCGCCAGGDDATDYNIMDIVDRGHSHSNMFANEELFCFMEMDTATATLRTGSMQTDDVMCMDDDDETDETTDDDEDEEDEDDEEETSSDEDDDDEEDEEDSGEECSPPKSKLLALRMSAAKQARSYRSSLRPQPETIVAQQQQQQRRVPHVIRHTRSCSFDANANPVSPPFVEQRQQQRP